MTDEPDERAVRVSVLLPVYNAERFLAEAIESVLAQSFGTFELLILDDGSTDGSGKIIDRYAARDSRIRHFSRPNRGLVATLNELAGLARGIYLARMDADDVCLPDRFRLQVARLDAEPDLDALGGYWTCMDEDGYPIFGPRPPLDHDGIDGLNLIGTAALCHPTVMMRKDAFDAVGGYDPDYEAAEDLCLWLRLAEYGRLANLEDVVLRYRMVASSISGTQRDRQAQSTRSACEAAWRRRDLPFREVDNADWRPGPDRQSRERFALQWGWQAWNSGHRATARRYFLKALKISPFSLDAWRAVAFGMRGGTGPVRSEAENPVS